MKASILRILALSLIGCYALWVCVNWQWPPDERANTLYIRPGAKAWEINRTIRMANSNDTVFLAAGTWVLDESIELTTDGVFLRGAGVDRTYVTFATTNEIIYMNDEDAVRRTP